MAQRRMFSLHVVDTDVFLDMPSSTQNLYFHLCMRADDDGFVSNPKKIMKVVNCGEDDLKVLFTKRFILGFENGVIVIKHWKMHNYIAKDRYNETKYLDQKKQLVIKDNGSYTECIQAVDKSVTQVSKGKVSKGKVSKEKTAYRENVLLLEKEYDVLIEKYGTNQTNKILDRLSNYKLSVGKKYESDYGAINSWVVESCKATTLESNKIFYSDTKPPEED